MIPRRLLLLACGTLLILAHAGAATPASVQAVPASDPHFRYSGRIDFTDPASPVIVWEASTVAVDFDGDQLAIRFGGTTGQVFFNAVVDGESTVIALREGMPDKPTPFVVMGSGRHHLVLFKRSEASAGTTHFRGIEIAPGATVQAQAVPKYNIKMEIYGDSITAGACDEDGKDDQWDDRSTHNAAKSWAALTAAAFSADYRNISISGIGLSAGYDDVVMGQVWDRIYPTASSPKADLTQWTPDVVLVLLGDNDDSFPRDHKLPFPTDFVQKYTDLIDNIRYAYPMASIVLLNGGMWAGTHSEALEKNWGEAIAGLEARDPGISHYTFAHWTMNHPRAADHRALADELDAWLTRNVPAFRIDVVGMLGQLGQGDVLDVTPPRPSSGKTDYVDVEGLKKQPFVQPGAAQK
jgi:lysophospholipase L1-like esterase